MTRPLLAAVLNADGAWTTELVTPSCDGKGVLAVDGAGSVFLVDEGKIAVRRPSFRESQHPRDAKGRWIEKGGKVRFGFGKMGTVLDWNGGKLRVQDGKGRVYRVDARRVEYVEAPDGGTPSNDRPRPSTPERRETPETPDRPATPPTPATPPAGAPAEITPEAREEMRSRLAELGGQLSGDVTDAEVSERLAALVEAARTSLQGEDDKASLAAMRKLMDELETAAAGVRPAGGRGGAPARRTGGGGAAPRGGQGGRQEPKKGGVEKFLEWLAAAITRLANAMDRVLPGSTGNGRRQGSGSGERRETTPAPAPTPDAPERPTPRPAQRRTPGNPAPAPVGNRTPDPAPETPTPTPERPTADPAPNPAPETPPTPERPSPAPTPDPTPETPAPAPEVPPTPAPTPEVPPTPAPPATPVNNRLRLTMNDGTVQEVNGRVIFDRGVRTEDGALIPNADIQRVQAAGPAAPPPPAPPRPSRRRGRNRDETIRDATDSTADNDLARRIVGNPGIPPGALGSPEPSADEPQVEYRSVERLEPNDRIYIDGQVYTVEGIDDALVIDEGVYDVQVRDADGNVRVMGLEEGEVVPILSGDDVITGQDEPDPNVDRVDVDTEVTPPPPPAPEPPARGATVNATGKARPALYTYQRRNLTALNLDGDSNTDVAAGAAAIRGRQALTAPQARALASAVRLRAEDENVRPVQRRAMNRLADRLDIAGREAAGDFTPANPPARPVSQVAATDVGEGDTIGIPSSDGPGVIGKVTATRTFMSGRLTEVTVRDGEGNETTVVLSRATGVWLMPDLPDSTPAQTRVELVPIDNLRPGDTVRYTPAGGDSVEGTIRDIRTEDGALVAALDIPGGGRGELRADSTPNVIRTQRGDGSRDQGDHPTFITPPEGEGEPVAPADVQLGDYVEVVADGRTTRGWIVAPPEEKEGRVIVRMSGYDSSEGERRLVFYPSLNESITRIASADEDTVSHVKAQQEAEYARKAGVYVSERMRGVRDTALASVVGHLRGAPDRDSWDGTADWMAEQLTGDYFKNNPRNDVTREAALIAAAMTGNRQPGEAEVARAKALLEQVRDKTVADAIESVRNHRPRPAETDSEARARLARQFAEQPPEPYRLADVGTSLARFRAAMGGAQDSGADAPPVPEGADLAARMTSYRSQLGGTFGSETRRVPTFGDLDLNALQAGQTPAVEWRETSTPSARAADGGPSEETMRQLSVVRAAGAELRTRMQSRMDEKLGGEGALAQHEENRKRLETLTRDYAALNKQFRDASNVEYRRLLELNPTRNFDERGQMIDEAERIAADRFPQREEMRQQVASLRQQVNDMNGRLALARREAAVDTLKSAGIDMGGDGFEYRKADRYGRATTTAVGSGTWTVKAMRAAEEVYPKAWLDDYRAHIKGGPIPLKEVKRGFYNPGTGVVALSSNEHHDGGIGVRGAAVAVHELGHGMEAAVPGLAAAEEALLWSRTSTGDVGSREREKISTIYQGTTERGWRDEFPTHYTGKWYPGQPNYEVFTTSIESVFAGSRYADNDLTDWTLGVLALLGTGGAKR